MSGSIVMLTSDGPEHRYLAAAVAAAFPDRLRAVVLARPPREALGARLRRQARRYSARQLASRLYARLWRSWHRRDERRRRTLQRVLFPDGGQGSFPREDLVRLVPGHNGRQCQELLKELEPDVLVIYGTAIIRAPVIRLARVAALNMHTGISPRYRGSDTVFWPLYHGEPEWVGVTIHYLDEGIDSGDIIATGRPRIQPEDDEDSLFAKCVLAGADLYVAAIRDILGGVGRRYPQELSAGREFRFVDRTVTAERRVDRLLREGLLHGYGDSAR